MHALVIVGSRNAEGMTAQCANAVARGLAKAGVSSELAFLPALNIERCRQCDPDGWGICLREGHCVIEDDFASLVEKLKSADMAVFASPVYFRDLSESMRAFVDRLRRISYKQKKRPLQWKLAVGVCSAGSGGGGAPSACFSLDYALQWIGFDVADMIAVRRQNLNTKILVLEATGEWLGSRRSKASVARGIPKGLTVVCRVSTAAYIAYSWLRRRMRRQTW